MKLNAPQHFGIAPGRLEAGDEVPDTFIDTMGVEQNVDVGRLRELGVIEGEEKRPPKKQGQKRSG